MAFRMERVPGGACCVPRAGFFSFESFKAAFPRGPERLSVIFGQCSFHHAEAGYVPGFAHLGHSFA